jgi:hypothetical protein
VLLVMLDERPPQPSERHSSNIEQTVTIRSTCAENDKADVFGATGQTPHIDLDCCFNRCEVNANCPPELREIESWKI